MIKICVLNVNNFYNLLLVVVCFLLASCDKQKDIKDLYTSDDYVNVLLKNETIKIDSPVVLHGYRGDCLDDRYLLCNNSVNIDLSRKYQILNASFIDKKYKKNVAHHLVIADDNMYYCNSNGELVCMDKNNNTLWNEKLITSNNTCNINLSYDHQNKIIVITSDSGFIAAFDIGTRKKLWSIDSGIVLRGGAAISNGKALIMRYDNTVMAFDIKSGKHIWSLDKLYSDLAFFNMSNFSVSGDKLLCSYPTGECALLSIKHGDEYWNNVVIALNADAAIDLCGVLTAKPMLYKGYAIITNTRGNTTAIDENTGDILWKNNVGSKCNLCIHNDWIFAIDSNNNLVAISIKTGKLKYKIDVHNQLSQHASMMESNQRFSVNISDSDKIQLSNPLIVNGKIMVADGFGSLLFFNVQTGELENIVTYTSVTNFTPTKVFVADGIIYVTSNDARLYIIK